MFGFNGRPGFRSGAVSGRPKQVISLSAVELLPVAFLPWQNVLGTAAGNAVTGLEGVQRSPWSLASSLIF